MLKRIKSIFTSTWIIKKIIAYTILIWVLYVLKDFLMLFLITFLISYLSFVLVKNISDFIRRKIKKDNKIIKFLTSINFLASLLYIFYVLWFIFFITHLIPILLNELNNIWQHIPIVKDQIKNITSYLAQVQHTQQKVSADFSKIMTEKNIEIIKSTILHLKSIWREITKFLLAFILSYFFIIDRKRLSKYLEGIKNSTLRFLYEEYSFLFWKIAKWFLLIFRAQSKIALTNTILTFLGLHIISFIIWHNIPYLGILTFIVFVFSFVPVLGVIFSSIPIALIVYNLSWFYGVLYVILMILIIHAIEAYILNPRFVSEEVELPVSLTFLLLLIWEHLFWPIWLIIAVPLFYIVIEIFKDIDKWIKKIN